MQANLEVSFLLDRQWHFLKGEVETTKRLALIALARVLANTKTPYAIIGGVALTMHQSDPRTTVDIDVAVPSVDLLPREELVAAGFRHWRRFPHSDNWIGPEGVPVQFTGDAELQGAVERSLEIEFEGVTLRVVTRPDLVHEKLRAGSDPARRRSKRLQDVADVESLLEETPELRNELSHSERELIDRLLGELPS